MIVFGSVLGGPRDLGVFLFVVDSRLVPNHFLLFITRSILWWLMRFEGKAFLAHFSEDDVVVAGGQGFSACFSRDVN